MKIIGIIPARGGSKAIRHKATRPFCGKPLIAWSILSAKKSAALHRIIVLTDSPTIARVARRYGAEVPFLEPAALASGVGGIELPIRFVYEKLIETEGYKANAIAMLMPTNPLRQPFHITQAITLFKKKKCDAVVAVNETPANHTPFWTLVRTEKTGAALFGNIPLKNIYDRRQDFPHACYARNDLIYLFKPQNLYDEKPGFYGKKVELYETSPLYEMDINTPAEWLMAEIHFKHLQKKIP